MTKPTNNPWPTRPVTTEVTHGVTIPDRLKIERYAKAPELGPSILFFSGGSALRELSRRLVDFSHNSIHIMTAFDSGGSSAKLRRAFKMLSIGDLRARIMDLADTSVKGTPATYRLFAHRLPVEESPAELLKQLQAMAGGTSHQMRQVPEPMRSIIRTNLQVFIEQMPDDFDLSGASMGNLILAGGWHINNQQIDPVI